MQQITNYFATALYVKPNDIPHQLWNTFLCDFPRCSQEITLPQDPIQRYQKSTAILIAAIMDNFVSYQQLDLLFTIRDKMQAMSSQFQKIVLDYNKFLTQITPWHNKDQFQQHLKQQREYIYSHINDTQGQDLLFNVYKCILLCAQMFFGTEILRNKRKLTKQELIIELTSDLTEEDPFIIKDHHLMALSQFLSLPIQSYYNFCDGQQIFRKRIHQLSNIKQTIGLFFEPGHNNKSAKSVRILYQQHDSIYVSNSDSVSANIENRKNQMMTIHKMQTLLECALESTINNCHKIVKQKDVVDFWPEKFYVQLQTFLIETQNFKVVKMDEILSNLDSFIQLHLEQFRTKTDTELKKIQPNLQISPNRPKIFQSTKFRNEQAIFNYQHRTIVPISNDQQPLKPPNLGQPVKTLELNNSISPQSTLNNNKISKSIDYHDQKILTSQLVGSYKDQLEGSQKLL